MSFQNIFKKSSEFRRIEHAVKTGLLPLGITGLSYVHKAHYISSLSLALEKKCLIICDTEGAAAKMAEDLNFFDGEAYLYPQRDFSFSSSAVNSLEYIQQRLGVLGRIIDGNYKYIVTTLDAAAQFTIPKAELEKRSIKLAQGEEVSPERLMKVLVSAGYGRSDSVEGHGQFASRGEILDFFPPDSALPVRVEFWGDEINLISYFDPETQRRTDNIDEIKITPSKEIVFEEGALEKALTDFLSTYKRRNSALAKEVLGKDLDKLQNGIELSCCDKYINFAYPESATLFDYFSDELFIVAETRAAKINFERRAKELDQTIKEAKKLGELAVGIDVFQLNFKQITDLYMSMGAVYMDNFERGSFDTIIKSLHRISDARTNAAWNGTVSALFEDLEIAKARNYSTVVVAGTEKMAKNVADDLCSQGYEAMAYKQLPESFSEKTITVLSGSLSGGFEYEYEKFMLISYRHGATGNIRAKKQKEKSRVRRVGQINLEEIKRGDYVVHSDYGIGIFLGIETKTVLNTKADYLKIQYSDGELFVPVEKIYLLTKYMSPEDADKEVKLNSFNSTKSWERTKSKVEESVKQVAKELANMYSKRISEMGFAFSADDDLQNLFESKFEYEETEDQLLAINDIKRDMQSVHPMDRLLLGDVGFGKTEVALRGVFKCVEEGKQCAILVPTTILALQHFQTLKKRFDGFAINIEMLSRFRTVKEKNKIKKDLKAGILDIVVGTHGLIADSIEFRDLGLLVIDEEQRFGVKQKEKIKKKFPLVDVLTLSATPIPRTLNMAVSGIRDMSILEVPPQDRHPVQTFVVEHDMEYLCKAMEREINRGGQVYYLHNKVDDIDKVAEGIRHFLPDARVGIGHGKMNEEELSEVWRSLLDGEIDILVCTTIIETGVDVPNANTLIIENADRLGLAQLHQIRGRVGRSARRAYAYFTYKKDRSISDTGQARLQAIEQYTSFGAGYHIAMRDLEIRGAGEILGTQQHGHMAAVGYDMYIQMLNEAVAELGEVEYKKPRTPAKLSVNIDMSIPDTYIQSYANRIEIYKRILAISSTADAQDVLDEIIDRFGNEMKGGKNTGSIPKCVADLVKYAELKARATAVGITEAKQSGRFVIVYADKITMKHAMMMRKMYNVRVLVDMEGYRQRMKVPIHGMQVLMTIERAIRCFELEALDNG